MRLVWSLNPGDTRCLSCGREPVHQGRCNRCRHEQQPRAKGVRKRVAFGAMIGPRVRLPQAKDVPEDAILRVLRAEPLRTFTHWNLDADNSLPRLAPELATFPVKVLVAKLASLKRRGLVDGRAKADQRGDWHIRTWERLPYLGAFIWNPTTGRIRQIY